MDKEGMLAEGYLMGPDSTESDWSLVLRETLEASVKRTPQSVRDQEYTSQQHQLLQRDAGCRWS